MKTVVIVLLSSLVFLFGCNTLKETQVELASGNYEQAIRTSVENLRKSRTKKKSGAYILMLEDAYAKAVDRDMRSIQRLEKETSGDALEEVYNTYRALHNRQEYVRPLLPLYEPDTGREAQFVMTNYDEAIYVSKNNLSEDLHQRASTLLRIGTKIDARVAYDYLNYLDQINPDYKDTRTLISDAHNMGTDYVFIHLDNHTDHIIPEDLENDLLQIDAYKLNKHWTVYHSVPLEDIDYDYELAVAIRDITIGPERIREKEVIRERQIKDGYTYELDDNGNVKKDSSGNDIRSDRYITVRSKIQEFTQSKLSKIVAHAEYISNLEGQVITSIPLISEYIFVHHYCTHNGDLRALDDYYNGLLRKALVPFPSSEQMIYDSGEDLKRQLKEIIAANEF